MSEQDRLEHIEILLEDVLEELKFVGKKLAELAELGEAQSCQNLSRPLEDLAFTIIRRDRPYKINTDTACDAEIGGRC